MYNNYKEKFKLIEIQMSNTLFSPKIGKKWSPVIIDKLGIDNNFLNKELSKFLECYQVMEASIPKYVRFDPFQYNQNKEEYPDDYIELQKILDLFKRDIDDFLIYGTNTKMEIKSEYYNVVSMRKGLLLESGIRIEDGKFLDSRHQEKVDKELKKIIDLRIEYILCPDKRNFLLREDKIKRILKIGSSIKDI